MRRQHGNGDLENLVRCSVSAGEHNQNFLLSSAINLFRSTEQYFGSNVYFHVLCLDLCSPNVLQYSLEVLIPNQFLTFGNKLQLCQNSGTRKEIQSNLILSTEHLYAYIKYVKTMVQKVLNFETHTCFIKVVNHCKFLIQVVWLAQ